MIFAVISTASIIFFILMSILVSIILFVIMVEYCNRKDHKIDKDIKGNGFRLDDKTIDDEIKEHYRDIGGEG